ncbi:hypothetical protein [Ruminococcus sp.]|uniref:hypothetical protein n=1 Tax=Ruminococcus sp. TaxID=41978 RepID=UPI002E81F27D|nr:hypothetical protein [Ruminococcus sp.]MEE3493155.1 hypothetical protein [Ruminococcus sp.]
MKKIIAVLLSVLLVLSVGMLFVSADDAANSIDVHVTIVDEKSDFAVAYETVTVTDIDNDEALTVNDALYAAHEQFYDGGAAAGYATETTKWGLSLMKLWGVANGGSYGYLVNNAFAWSLTDPVKADDYIVAFIYTDTKDFSDVYTYFEPQYIEEESTSIAVELTMMKTGFDAEGKPYTEPVSGAEITLDGQKNKVVTDAEGKAGFYYGYGDPNGYERLVSAEVKDMRIVPPICLLKAVGSDSTPDQADGTEAPTVVADVEDIDDTTITDNDAPSTGDESTKDSSTNDSATKDSAASGSTPQTGDVSNLILWIVIAAVCLAGIIGAAVFYKKRYGKK